MVTAKTLGSVTELAIYTSMSEPVVKTDANQNMTTDFSRRSDVEKLLRDGVLYRASEDGRRSDHFCYFRASERSGGRAEQFVAVYSGELEPPKKLAQQTRNLVADSEQLNEVMEGDVEILTRLLNAQPRFPENTMNEASRRR